MPILTSRQKMGAAALIMAFSILLSRLMGLVRDKVISWQFGAGGEADIYFAAFVVPDFLNYLLAGGYVSITLIPLLSRLFVEDENEAWRFFSVIFCWASLAIGVLTLAAWLAAPWLAPLIAPGFDAAQQARLATFLRIVLPAQIFFLPGACFSAVLYIRRQFTVPALMPLIYNGCILLGGVALPWLGLTRGMEGFCWGVTAGAAVGAFWLPLRAVRAGGLRLFPAFSHPLLPRFLLLALPLMLGQSVVVLDEQFVRIFGSMAGEGAVSLLNYARRLMMVPVGVVAQAAGVASFPFLAALAAQGRRAEFDSTLNRALCNSLIVVLPVTLWLIAAARPLLGFIFEGGGFDAADTALTTPLLRLMLLAVPFWVLQQVTGRAFYAHQDTLTPAVVGTLATLLAVPAYFALVPRWGAPGVALVTSVSLGVYATALATVARVRWGGAPLAGLGRAALANTLICAPGFALALWLAEYAPLPAWPPLARQFAELALSGTAFAALYIVLARLFLPRSLEVILGPVSRRMGRGRGRDGGEKAE